MPEWKKPARIPKTDWERNLAAYPHLEERHYPEFLILCELDGKIRRLERQAAKLMLHEPGSPAWRKVESTLREYRNERAELLRTFRNEHGANPGGNPPSQKVLNDREARKVNFEETNPQIEGAPEGSVLDQLFGNEEGAKTA